MLHKSLRNHLKIVLTSMFFKLTEKECARARGGQDELVGLPELLDQKRSDQEERRQTNVEVDQCIYVYT